MAIPIVQSRWRHAGILLLTLYVLAGAIYSLALPPTGRFSDEREYLALSDHLRHGPGYSLDGIRLTASRPPGYPYFIAGIEAVGGGVAAVRVIQFMLVGATVLLVTRLTRDSDDGTNLPIVTGLVILYPVLFYTSATLYPQTLAGFLFVLALTCLLKCKGRSPVALAAGLIFGALVLVVPTFGLTVPVVLGGAWWLSLIRWREAVLILAGTALAIMPWTVRNALVFNQFVPMASNSGANFLIGNCENTVPYGGSGNVDRTRYRQEAQALGLDEFQEDRYYRQAAIAWMEAHPGRAVLLYFEKAANFFNVYNEFAPENKAEVSLWKQAVMAATYGALLALLGWRLLDWNRFPPTPRDKLFLLVFFLSAFTCAIFFTRIRLRLPYDYLIITVIAGHLSQRLRGGSGLSE